jgi:ketosteroid isomerase-like protein
VIDDIIVGEDPNSLVVRSRSDIDVEAGATWGNKHVTYKGRYVQIFRFIDGKVKSFEEYYDTAKIAEAYR